MKHPDFNTTAGPLEGNDIAVIKVDDSAIQGKISSLQLWPICLPIEDKKKKRRLTGIHTGWSQPPPLSYLEEEAPAYHPLH